MNGSKDSATPAGSQSSDGGTCAARFKKLRQYARSIASGKKRQPPGAQTGTRAPIPVWVLPPPSEQPISHEDDFQEINLSKEPIRQSDSSLVPVETGKCLDASIEKYDIMQRLPLLSAQVHARAELQVNKYPPLSPRFLNPRRAPKPPSGAQVDESVSHSKSEPTQSMICDLPSIDTFDRGRNKAISTLLPLGFPSDLIDTLPSRPVSGLERIGVALLGTSTSTLTTDRDRYPIPYTTNASHRSMDSVFDALEWYGIQARDILVDPAHRENEDFNDIPVDLIHSTSAPARLSTHASFNDVIRRNSQRLVKDMRASISGTLSNLEQLLHDQGVHVPSAQEMTALWKALSPQSNKPLEVRYTNYPPQTSGLLSEGKTIIEGDEPSATLGDGESNNKEPFMYGEGCCAAPDGAVGVAL